jgi:putative transposase
MMLARGVLVS